MRELIIELARQWIGTPWHHQGRVRGVGCDCAGLLIGVAREAGIADVAVTGYSTLGNAHSLLAWCDQYMARISFGGVKIADVLCFRVDENPQHLALLAQNENGWSIIHAYARSRKVVENRLDDWWQSRIVAVYRLPGLE